MLARSTTVAFSLALLALPLAALPAQAWSLAPQPPSLPDATLTFDEVRLAWTVGMAPSAFPGDLADSLLAAPGCALGDVNGDGIGDLLLLEADAANGTAQLRAVAGPGFTEVLWRQTSTLDRVLRCAPDLDASGTTDPILHLLGDAAAGGAGPVADAGRQQVQRILDGATGQALVGRADATAQAGTEGAVAAAQSKVTALLPAAQGTAAYLQTTATSALAQLPVPVPVPVPGALPIDALGGNLTEAAELQILDSAGAVLTTVSIDQAGVQPLALSPVPLTGALPDVAVLTRSGGATATQAAAGVPQLALHVADGTVAWTRELPASTGLPVLLPRAGDLDLDGVGDMIVSTVHQGANAAPGAAYQVLSGVDGSTLFDSGPAVTGLVAAVPLGQLGGGPAVLQAVAPAAQGALTLSALGGAGQVLWSVELDSLAVPVNQALDPFTGDVLGFSDLTGDGLPDVAVAAQSASGLALQAVDGATGAIAWTQELTDVQRVIPVDIPTAALGAAGQAAGAAQDAADTARSVAGGASGAIDGVTPGSASALLALGTTGSAAVLKLIDPATGQVAWAVQAPMDAASKLAHLDASAAGDLDADGVQDLLVTATFGEPDEGASAAASMRTRQPQGTNGSDGSGAAVAAVSGATGQTTYTDVTDAESGAQDLQFGVRSDEAEPASSDGKDSPGLAPLTLAVAVVGLAMLLRRRRA